MANEGEHILLGGWSDEKKATPDIQEFCDTVRLAFQEKVEENFRMYEALAYISQVVAGKNYIAKVTLGDQCVHLKFYQTLPRKGSKVTLIDYQMHHTTTDPILPFK